MRRLYGTMYAQYPNAEHVHFWGLVIGNRPDLEFEDISWLTEGLNNLVKHATPQDQREFVDQP